MKTKRKIWFGAVGTLCALASASALWVTRAGAVGIPATGGLSYSGTLEDESGAPLTGSKEVRLEVFDAVSGGKSQCAVTQTVALSGGRFQIILPDECAAAVSANPNLWVEVVVDSELLGRTKLAAVPYAFEANRASAAGGVLATQIVPAGAVMAFDLAACPAGWVPIADAAGRVVVGATTGLARGAKVGADSVALSVGQMPSHAHEITDPGHAHNVSRTVDYNVPPSFAGGSQGIGPAVTTSSTNVTGISVNAAGGGQPFDNRQASLALLYCKKS